MTNIIDGKSIAEKLEKECKLETSQLITGGVVPTLAIIAYNPDAASQKYINLKLKKSRELGIKCMLLDWSDKNFDECMVSMENLANDPEVHGIIMQLPAKGLGNVQSLLDYIPANKDVDGLSSKKSKLTPATPKAILTLLEKSGVSLAGKNIAIIGQGKLVGRPLTLLLNNKGFDVSTADSKTTDIAAITKKADIVISAVGKPGLINGSMIKPGAVVIDAGTSEQNNSLIGDVDYESVDGVAGKLAKVPGGVGPVTVACLLHNVIEATKTHNSL
jgi:methylenetetrahydrofolate dehydrogenase (NADP+)/methenyltetrahydrofolate cyclohydrolase